MPTYGVTPTGFYAKPLATIQSEVDSGLKAILGDSAGTEADGTIPLEGMAGQLKTLLVDGYAALWDLLEAIYAATDPSSAVGAALDSIAAITGSVRQAASTASASCVCVGTNGTSLPVGRVIEDSTTSTRFASATGLSIATLSDWATATEYSKADLVGRSGLIYSCTVAGLSASGPSGLTMAVSIADGTATWRFIATGSAAVAGTFNAEESGELGALAGNLTVISTPVSGWESVVNPLDAVSGRDREEDAVFRVRRDAEVSAPGNTTADAIRANILKVNEGSDDPDHEPPTDCLVFYNDTDVTDGNGVPPHSVEILVRDGTTEDIAQEIWNSIGAGTRTYGTRSDSVEDSEGNTQTVNWSRPTEIPIYVVVTVKYNAAEWPSDATGDDVAEYVKSALLTATEDYPLARDVRVSPLIAAIMRGPAEVDTDGTAVVPAAVGSDPVPGLLEVETTYIGTSAAPGTSTQISIGRREYAAFASARLTVTASSEEP